MRKITILTTTLLMGGAIPAAACTTPDETVAYFNEIKDAYVAHTPNMKPADYQVWAEYLRKFGELMSKNDMAGACDALDEAALELGFFDSEDNTDVATDADEDDSTTGGGVGSAKPTVIIADTPADAPLEAPAIEVPDDAPATTVVAAPDPAQGRMYRGRIIERDGTIRPALGG